MEDKKIAIDEERVNRIVLRVPPFWPEEPELWFAQLESQCELAGITEESSKYAYTLAKLEPKHAKEIKDIITKKLPAAEKYEAVKKALIQRLTVSQEQRTRQLLEHEELGDRKPSQFLRHLSTLAGAAIPEDLLRTLWLGRLPTQMQTILATRTQDNLEDVAEQADRIHEVGNKAVVLATALPPATSTMEAQIEALRTQVAALTTQMTKMAKQTRRGRERYRERSRTRERSKSRTKKPVQEGICYYHRRFGKEAQKCTTPCTFKAENEEGSR